MKLQQAYFSESLKAGGWTIIGYAAPGVNGLTTNFAYGMGSGIATNTATAVTSSTVGWTAHNLAKLNECTGASRTGSNTEATGNWQVSIQAAAGAQDLTFDAKVNGGADCLALTPTFENIGK